MILQRWLVANHHEMRIVFITAHDENEKTRERCLRDGAVAYLVKPVDAKTLRDVLTPVMPNRLLHCIAGPAIAVRPEWALRAGLSFGVVDPLLMRTAYDSIRQDD